MAQSKMKFGIDLGTTNSAICKMESGEPVIKKDRHVERHFAIVRIFYKKENCKKLETVPIMTSAKTNHVPRKNGLMTAKTYSLSLNEIWVRTNRMKVLIWENLFLQSNFLPKF